MRSTNCANTKPSLDHLRDWNLLVGNSYENTPLVCRVFDRNFEKLKFRLQPIEGTGGGIVLKPSGA